MSATISRAVRWFAVVTLAVLVTLGVTAAVPAGAAPESRLYQNPVSRTFADTFADPAVVRGLDGWWYAYGTTDPLRSGEGVAHTIPMARSRDLTEWEYVGDAFPAGSGPAWAGANAALWAPDVRYVAGRWLMYYVVTQTIATPGPNDNAIGVATAPSPTGPWTDSGAPVVGPRPGATGNPDDFLWTFDPAHLVAADGRQYLYYGSYYGGVFAVQLSADGTRAVGEPTMVAVDNRYEGAYVVPHGGWYYLFASSSNCCAGPVTGYSVFVGRSRSPLGPFVDRDGVPLTASRTGGTIVVTPNGNRWVGTGHNAMVTDPSGQDWLVYHAIDRGVPYLDEPFGINRRPMLVDRLDWVRGWPTVRAGRWASDDAQRSPSTAVLADAFETGGLTGWRAAPGWSVVEGQGNGFARQTSPHCRPSLLQARRGLDGDIRLGVTVRTDAGFAGFVLGDTSVRVGAGRLSIHSYGRTWAAPLPTGLDTADWLRLTVEERAGALTAEVGPAAVDAPVATVHARVAGRHRTVGILAGCADVDDATAAGLYRPVRGLASTPEVGPTDPRYSDTFDSALEPQWTWVRPPAEPPTVEDGRLVWPTQPGDLTGDINDASVLVRDAPAGDYTVETKVTTDLGVDSVRNYQQAGLVVYSGDDDFLRFSHVAIWNTRATEFGKEEVYAGQPMYGSMLVAPPTDTTWLRLTHRVSRSTGEHTYRASVSTDGTHWTWGGVWTLPAGADPRIGLVSHGGAGATAEFDYLRVHRP